MKTCFIVMQWMFTILFTICTIANGFHWSSILCLLSAILMMPVHYIRKFFNGLKIKNWLIILLSTIIFITGMACSPSAVEDETPDNESSSYSEETSTSDTSSTTSTSETTSTSTTESSNSSTTVTTSKTETNTDVTTSDPDKNSNVSVGNGVAIPIDPSTLPTYSGNPYVVVNNNIPSFISSELTVVGYELYSNLDDLGRCGVAIASCGKEIMPADDEERESISSITPTGWIQAQYNGISGGYLWNRCHLIGWQLSAENGNPKNLITGTRYMNVSGMLPFENMVADYIKETNNHVAFRVTPIFEGDNLVCSGVQIEAYSIEDNGESIQFNVYCYNVQPGITIDYATGNSYSDSQFDNNETDTETSIDTETSTDNNTSTSEMVWIPATGSKYHKTSTCSNMNNPRQVTKEDAIQLGFEPCKRCY